MSGLNPSLEESDDARTECATCDQHPSLTHNAPPRLLGYVVVDVDGKPIVTRAGAVDAAEHSRAFAKVLRAAGRKVTVAALVEVPDA